MDKNNKEFNIFFDDISFSKELENDTEKTLNDFHIFLTKVVKKYENEIKFFTSNSNIIELLKNNFVVQYVEECIEDKSIIRNIKNKMQHLIDWTENKINDGNISYYQVDFPSEKLTKQTDNTLAEVIERYFLYNKTTNFALLSMSNDYDFLHLYFFKKTYLNEIFYGEIPFIRFKDWEIWKKINIDWYKCIEDKEIWKKIKTEFYNNSKYKDFDWEKWQPNKDFPNNLLPFRALSDLFTVDNWQDFREKIKKNAPEKISIISKMAKIVATINGYTFEKDISKLNAQKSGKIREIYSAGESNHKIYLSADFESGGFEVFSYNATWLGEYSFSGEVTSFSTKEEVHKKHQITLA